MMQLLWFFSGFWAAAAAVRLVARALPLRSSTILEPAELERHVKWGGVIGATSVIIYLACFGLFVCLIPIVLSGLPIDSGTAAFVLPAAFVLSLEASVGINEVVFAVAPVSMRPPSFEIGAGIRTRGAARLAFCISALCVLVLLARARSV